MSMHGYPYTLVPRYTVIVQKFDRGKVITVTIIVTFNPHAKCYTLIKFCITQIMSVVQAELTTSFILISLPNDKFNSKSTTHTIVKRLFTTTLSPHTL